MVTVSCRVKDRRDGAVDEDPVPVVVEEDPIQVAIHEDQVPVADDMAGHRDDHGAQYMAGDGNGYGYEMQDNAVDYSDCDLHDIDDEMFEVAASSSKGNRKEKGKGKAKANVIYTSGILTGPSPGRPNNAVEQVLTTNADIFVWRPKDMVGIDTRVMVHKLKGRPDPKPVKQKRRHFGAQQGEIVRREVEELLAIGHIREIHFPRWIVNVVLVPKGNGKWNMCVDFRQLNKACPRDHQPAAKDRPIGRFDDGLCLAEHDGCILGLSSHTIAPC